MIAVRVSSVAPFRLVTATSIRQPPVSLPWNWLHVFADHLVISGLPIAHVGHDDEYVTGETEREQGLVHETNIDAKRPVVDGMTDVIHDFTLNAGIAPSRGARTCRLGGRGLTIRHWSPRFLASVLHPFVERLLDVVVTSNDPICAASFFSDSCFGHAVAFWLALRRSVLRRTCPNREGLRGAEAIPFSCVSLRS